MGNATFIAMLLVWAALDVNLNRAWRPRDKRWPHSDAETTDASTAS